MSYNHCSRLRLESSNQHVFLWNDNISRSTISKPAVYLFDSFDFDSALMSRDMALFVRVIYEIARLPRNHRSRNLSARKPRCRARTEKERKKEREKLSIMIIAMEFLRVAKNCKQNEWLHESSIRWQQTGMEKLLDKINCQPFFFFFFFLPDFALSKCDELRFFFLILFVMRYIFNNINEYFNIFFVFSRIQMIIDQCFINNFY